MSATLKEILTYFLKDAERQKDNSVADLIQIKNLIQIQNEMLNLNKNSASKKINELREDTQRIDSEYHYSQSSPRLPYLYVYLSYAYAFLELYYDSVVWAQKARGHLWASKWDGAICYWYLGTLYTKTKSESESAEARKKLGDAQKYLEEYKKQVEQARETSFSYLMIEECQNIISKIEKQIRELPPRSLCLPSEAHHPGDTSAAPTGQIKHDGNTDGPVGGGGGNNSESVHQKNSNVGFPSPVNVTVHIPLEIKTNDVTEFLLSQEQHNQQQTDICNQFELNNGLNSTANQIIHGIDHPLLEEKTFDPLNQEQSLTFSPSYLITPSLPLYGGASAGPNGIVVLNEPDFIIDEEISLIRVNFKGNGPKEYKIYSMRADDFQISIPLRDFLASSLPKDAKERLKLGGRIYGWLKVFGHSMNKARPVPIENEDLILVQENHDPQACKNQIVVVSLPSDSSQAPRLVVKRLIEKGQKLFLHSDSEFPSDPLTNDNYEQDLEYTAEHQVIGVVIAVASDKPKPQFFSPRSKS